MDLHNTDIPYPYRFRQSQRHLYEYLLIDGSGLKEDYAGMDLTDKNAFSAPGETSFVDKATRRHPPEGVSSGDLQQRARRHPYGPD